MYTVTTTGAMIVDIVSSFVLDTTHTLTVNLLRRQRRRSKMLSPPHSLRISNRKPSSGQPTNSNGEDTTTDSR